jgi:hypothetical protein
LTNSTRLDYSAEPEIEIGFQFRTIITDSNKALINPRIVCSESPVKSKKHRSKRRGPKYWVVAIGTMGMLIAYCPGNSHNIVLGKVRPNDDTAAATQQQISFDIPAGTL